MSVSKVQYGAIIDGNALMYKYYFAIANSVVQDDDLIVQQTHSSIISTVQKILERQDYKFAAVVFDSSKYTFRTEIFPEYKSQRAPMPNNLVNTIPHIVQSLKNLKIPFVVAPQPYEADDVAGTIATQFANHGIVTDVFSTDRDFLQLVSYPIRVNLLKKGISEIVTYNHHNFQQLNDGLMPYQVPFFKSLAGDNSDNYKGIPGLGPKKTLELVKIYQNKDRLFKSIEELPEKIKSSLLENREKFELFLKISRIVTSVPLDNQLEDYQYIK